MKIQRWITDEGQRLYEDENAGEFAVLDHGYLQFIEHWGSDERIIESARMSTAKGFLGWGTRRECVNCHGIGKIQDQDEAYDCPKCSVGDEKLLRFLHEHKHSTPFEMAGFTIEVKAPIMVFREWHRHRVPFGYNEMSARYIPLPNENYSPTVTRIIEGATKAGANKQAQGATSKIPDKEDALLWLSLLADVYEHAQKVYESGLELGIPKELARLPVPVGRYSCMRATANLRGWLGFMTLRSAPAAQWEIRQYSQTIGTLVSRLYPRTWELFAEGMR